MSDDGAPFLDNTTAALDYLAELEQRVCDDVRAYVPPVPWGCLFAWLRLRR